MVSTRITNHFTFNNMVSHICCHNACKAGVFSLLLFLLTLLLLAHIGNVPCWVYRNNTLHCHHFSFKCRCNCGRMHKLPLVEGHNNNPSLSPCLLMILVIILTRYSQKWEKSKKRQRHHRQTELSVSQKTLLLLSSQEPLNLLKIGTRAVRVWLPPLCIGHQHELTSAVHARYTSLRDPGQQTQTWLEVACTVSLLRVILKEHVSVSQSYVESNEGALKVQSTMITDCQEKLSVRFWKWEVMKEEIAVFHLTNSTCIYLLLEVRIAQMKLGSRIMLPFDLKPHVRNCKFTCSSKFVDTAFIQLRSEVDFGLFLSISPQCIQVLQCFVILATSNETTYEWEKQRRL